MGNGEWGMGNGEWVMGNGEWKNNYQLPITNYQLPITNYQFPMPLIGKKTGNLPAASIIEFDLLFNAHADNQLWQKKDRDLASA
ncbi:hypothetical protein PI95_008970 [Hassallia byssoidea VB512170]|uniref:Uncharacterized protein n=1 Tax=Hassallia byssoidea VB512170 TaxID=1304833 RepID=A0A846H6U8_9CYAN|nr:hypothetical protein [Hassalia byssoidea]NEU72698.1 hypothetical protein [Hassalia byssoidea VB512170]